MTNTHVLVDLDRTLAHYDRWRGPGHIGAPIPAMVERVKGWLAAGREVRLFTARWSIEEQRYAFLAAWEPWSEEHLGTILPVTCTKDTGAVELWDDIAVRVAANEGHSCFQCEDDRERELAWQERKKLPPSPPWPCEPCGAGTEYEYYGCGYHGCGCECHDRKKEAA